MNLLLRLIWILLVSRFRSKVEPLGVCSTPFRVAITDLDVLRHMNNGKYLSILDLGRVDFMIRAGVAEQLTRKGWYPVVVGETIQFSRSLELFDKFTVESQILGWDDKAIILQQSFVRRGIVVATAIVRGRFLSKTREKVTPGDVL
ncbi:MAG: acyl-CoA thioesterase, partial [Bdellovibrionota bacterium]